MPLLGTVVPNDRPADNTEAAPFPPTGRRSLPFYSSSPLFHCSSLPFHCSSAFAAFPMQTDTNTDLIPRGTRGTDCHMTRHRRPGGHPGCRCGH